MIRNRGPHWTTARPTKVCTLCRLEKILTAFTCSQSRCKACRAQFKLPMTEVQRERENIRHRAYQQTLTRERRDAKNAQQRLAYRRRGRLRVEVTASAELKARLSAAHRRAA